MVSGDSVGQRSDAPVPPDAAGGFVPQVGVHTARYADAVQQIARDGGRVSVSAMREMVPEFAGMGDDELRDLGREWRDNWDGQVSALAEQHYDAYAAVLAEMTEAGEYPYNDSFRGRIGDLDQYTDKRPGVYGTMQDAVIYEMQRMRDDKAMHAQVDAFVAEGAEPIGKLDGPTRYSKVMCYGFYSGGGGVQTFEDVRVVPNADGTPYAVLEKGKRTNGKMLQGTVIGVRA